MRKFVLFIAIIIASFFAGAATTNAASIATPNTVATHIAAANSNGNQLTARIALPAPDVKKAPKKSIWDRLFTKSGNDNDILFYLACIFVGWLAIHRLLKGSKPVMIVWYILITVLGYILSYFIPFFGWIGWLVISFLPICDIITSFLHGTDYFNNNDDIFAGVKGLFGGK